MNKTKGMALVATLLVSVTLLVFGTGAIFLTQTDLTITDNVRANALAEERARAGLEASLIALKQEAEAHGAFPASLTLPTLDLVAETAQPFTAPDNAPNYEQRSPNEAVLRIQGLGPREASFVSEAVLSLTATPARQGAGLTAGGTVNIANWTDTRVLGAALHGDKGYALDGIDLSRFGDCTLRDLDGHCSIWQAHDMTVDADADGIPDALRVTAAANLASYLCDPAGNAALCDTVSGTATPRQFAQADVGPPDTDTLLNAALSPCTVTHATPPPLTNQAEVNAAGFTAGNTVCVTTGDITFPSNVALEDTTVIAEDGTIVFSGATLTRTKVIAKTVGLALSGVHADSSFLYSKVDLSIDSSAHVSGATVLVSGAALDFGATTEASDTGNGPEVDVNVYAQEDITYAAASDTFAQFTAGGSFTLNSAACIVGSVSATEDIRANGGVCIDSGLVAQSAAPARTTLSVVSRR